MKKYCFLLILLVLVLVRFTPAAEASFFVQAFSGPSKADTSRYVEALTITPSRVFSSGHEGDDRQRPAAGPVASAPHPPPLRQNDSSAPTPKPRKDLTIAWDPAAAPNLRGYRLYYGTDAGPPYEPDPADYAVEGPSPLTLAADATTLTLHGLTAGKDYFFAVTAFAGNDSPESEYSAEVASRPQPTAMLPAENAATNDQVTEDGNESREAEVLSLTNAPTTEDVGVSSPDAAASMPPAAADAPEAPFAPAPEQGNESREADVIAALQAIPEDIETFPASSVNSEEMQQTLLAPGDIVQISISSMPNLSQNYDVDPEGNLFIASIGSIQVKDLTLAAFQKLLEEMLDQFYALREKPEVRLVAAKRFIQITGGVQYPGWYRVNSEEKLTDLINMAGGLMEGVDEKGILLLRKTAAGMTRLPVSETIRFHTSDNLTIPRPDLTSIKVDNGDLLYLRVPMERNTGEQEAQDPTNRSQIEVDRYGYLTVPLYGNIFVKGLTTAEIIQTITEKLPKYLAQSAEVKVNIIEKRHYVQVLGHVANPGWHNIPESANVQTALNTAGGILDGAIMSEVGVIRQTPTGPKKIMVNLFQYSISGDERLLSPLHEDDVIFVPISAAFGNVKRTLASWSPPDTKLEKDSAQKVRITGAVNAPGVYEPTKDMDLLEILILAKGESENADLSNIQVIRDQKSTAHNLTKLLQDSKPLPQIQSGDTVRVGYMERSGYKQQASEEKVRIFGGILKPGGYEIKKEMNLIDLIILGGGERDNSDLSDIKIFRADGSSEVFDMNKFLLEEGAGGYNDMPVLHNGDAVRIGYLEATGFRKKSTGQKVRIFGGVSRPAAFDPTVNMHLIDLITLAGGETDSADLSNIKIFRAAGGTETFNLNKVMQETGGAGFAELPKIYAGDAVRIGFLEREGYKRKSTDKKVRIYGAVVKSGAYEVEKDMHLIDLLILASGEQEIADLSNITIFRDSGAAEKFNLNQFLQDNPEGGYREMPRVYGGDAVHVAYLQRQDYQTAESIYVLGQARGNGEYQLDDNMTVLQALALAGGLADYADTENIMILRTVDGKQINIPYNFEMGITGKYPELNIRLRPNDVVYVP